MEGLVTLNRILCTTAAMLAAPIRLQLHNEYHRLKMCVSAKMSNFTAESVEDAISDAASKLGYLNLKKKQRKAILSFVKENDVFVSLPTGSGKSLCSAVLPRIFDVLRHHQASLAIVVSSLIALMKDQVGIYTKKGLNAVYVCQLGQ